jgi:hypothetical protein
MKFGSPKMFGRNTTQWHSVPAEIAMVTFLVPTLAQRTGSSGHFSRCW